MDNIRFVLIVTFAMLIFMMTQAWQEDYGPKPAIAAVAKQNSQEDLPNAVANSSSGAQVTTQEAVVVPNTAPSTAKVIRVKTDVIALEINTEGGTIQNLDLLNYPVEKDNPAVNWLRGLVGMTAAEKNHAPVRLFNSDLEKVFLAQSGLIASSDTALAPNHYTVFNNEQNSYTLAAGQDSLTVPLTWTDNNGVIVTKAFTFKRGSYQVTLDQSIKNDSGKPWSGRQYSQLLRLPDVNNQSNMLTGGMRAYDGGVIYTEKNKYQKVSFDDMAEENLDLATQGGWTALIQHYFATAWVPPANLENHFYTKRLQDGRFVIGSYSPTITVADDSTAQFTAQLFAGPKIQPMMEKIAKGLELTVDYSVLTFIGKPIYWLLNQIHNIIGNWGLAIIGVTLCIKALLFLPAQAGFRSMAKMRKVQPRLKELQERFKDDRPRFNKEMMDLYKKEKVNPMGGCLPIMLQIPVFMALYWVLSETVEFRQAAFMLWIDDLSVQDPFFILPIIYGITMKFQQGLNPAPIDPIQAKVMQMFPIVFTVFFLFFPAGLVLYWVINGTLSIAQQWYITKKINEAD